MRKALWVVRDRITTAKAIDDLLADATTRGIFDLVVQVRGRGDAYYRSELEPQALALAGSDLAGGAFENLSLLQRLVQHDLLGLLPQATVEPVREEPAMGAARLASALAWSAT